MCVPGVVSQAFPVKLGHTLSEPDGDNRACQGKRDQLIGITLKHVRPFLLFIIEPLEIDSRKLAGHFPGCSQRDHMAELMGHHVSQPVMSAPESKIHGGRHDLHFIVVIIGSAVRIIFMVPYDEMDFAVRPVLIERGDGLINFFSDLRYKRCSPVRALMKVHIEMPGLNGSPVELRMVVQDLCGNSRVPE